MPCSAAGIVEDNFVVNVEHGKTYMLIRLVNAALFSEYYFKVAGHKFTVVGADANYITLYTLHHRRGRHRARRDVRRPHGRRCPALPLLLGRASQPAAGPGSPDPVFISRGIV
jgi:laccase